MEKIRRTFIYKIYALPVGGKELWHMFMMVGRYIVER